MFDDRKDVVDRDGILAVCALKSTQPARQLILPFGLHIWNEVLLDRSWVPMDSSLNWTEIGVTHICLGTKDQPGVSFQTMTEQTLKLIEVERAQ